MFDGDLPKFPCDFAPRPRSGESEKAGFEIVYFACGVCLAYEFVFAPCGEVHGEHASSLPERRFEARDAVRTDARDTFEHRVEAMPHRQFAPVMGEHRRHDFEIAAEGGFVGAYLLDLFEKKEAAGIQPSPPFRDDLLGLWKVAEEEAGEDHIRRRKRRLRHVSFDEGYAVARSGTSLREECLGTLHADRPAGFQNVGDEAGGVAGAAAEVERDLGFETDGSREKLPARGFENLREEPKAARGDGALAECV